jgi:hypothetical protein
VVLLKSQLMYTDRGLCFEFLQEQCFKGQDCSGHPGVVPPSPCFLATQAVGSLGEPQVGCPCLAPDMILRPGQHAPKAPTRTCISVFQCDPVTVHVRMF